MPIIENQDPTEPRLDPDNGGAMEKAGDQLSETNASVMGEHGFDETGLLAFLKETRRLSRRYQRNAALSDWEQAQLAYRSEHGAGSKYHKDQYKNRAKYFKPKTRAAVRKNLTATANAMFASRDVLSVSAERAGDQNQRANAALIKGIIDHRLNSKVRKIGVPWFQIALGARFDAQLTAACCSKQTWRYKTRKRTEKSQEEQPYMLPDGTPAIDQATGQPMMQLVEVQHTIIDVIEDRPDITLIPSEFVLLDPGSDWIDPAQNSPTLIVIWPMHVDDVKAMMDEEKNLTPWRRLTDDQLKSAIYSETELQGIKAAREGSGSTVGQNQLTNGAQLKGDRNEIVEMRECFFRRDGCDYHCWSLKDVALASDAVPVEDVYPAHRGVRPYVLGTDVLEPHVLYKQSHVRSWKQSQDEINDFANLHMDGTRQAVYPVAKVKAGKNIDYKAVQRRDGQGVLLVREMDDIEWDRPPGPPPNVHEELNLLSNDFDEIAGIFSQNSVQSNRQLNETVGGMQIISANANATSSFDLMCFVQTWAEPVLTQIVSLEQYYEDDANLIAIAGEKAKLFEKYGVDQVTDELLESQISIQLNVGLGSSDPMQKLVRFKTSMELAMPMLSLALKTGKAKINFEEVFAEIFGNAGYRDGADRFITVDENGQQQGVDPEKMQQMGELLQKLQEENQQLKQQAGNKSQQIQADGMTKVMEIAADHKAKTAEIAQKAQADFTDSLLGLLGQTMSARISAGQGTDAAALDARLQMILGLLGQAKEIHIAGIDSADTRHATMADAATAAHATNVGADTNLQIANMAPTAAPSPGP